MRILDRYVLKKFVLPFLYCLLGFIAIWLIVDLSDNLQDFLQGKVGMAALIEYYSSQIPEVIVLCLPICMLLALLYSLTAMSRSNEIISMLGAGISVTRILVPLIAIGGVLTVITAYFNVESAPHAASIKKQMLGDIKRGGTRREPGLQGHLYRNREDLRTWFMRRIIPGKSLVSDVQIIQQNKAGDITAMWYAQDANYYPESGSWVLYHPKYVEMDAGGNLTKVELPENKMVVTGWRETPWRISSSVMNPDYLSVGELADYLNYNHDYPAKRLVAYQTQWHYRWAWPFVCLLVVFIAAPLGIVYSRRGIIGGVAGAIVIFFMLFFTSIFCVALGKGFKMSPILAAWGPLVFYFGVGLCLLWFRSTNRDLPKIKLPSF